MDLVTGSVALHTELLPTSILLGTGKFSIALYSLIPGCATSYPFFDSYLDALLSFLLFEIPHQNFRIIDISTRSPTSANRNWTYTDENE